MKNKRDSVLRSNVERGIKEINSIKKRLETFDSESSSIELPVDEPSQERKCPFNVGKVFRKPVKTSTFHRQCFRTCKNCPSDHIFLKGGQERTRKVGCLEQLPVRYCPQSDANVKKILKNVHLTWASDDSSYKEIKEPNKKKGVHQRPSEILMEYFHTPIRDERTQQKREEAAVQVNLDEDKKDIKRRTRRAQWKTEKVERSQLPEHGSKLDKPKEKRAHIVVQKEPLKTSLREVAAHRPVATQTSAQEPGLKVKKDTSGRTERARSSPPNRPKLSPKERAPRSYEKPTMCSLMRSRGAKENLKKREEVRPFTAGAPSKTHNIRMKIQETLSMMKRIKPTRIEPLFNDIELLFTGTHLDRSREDSPGGDEAQELLCQKDFLARTKRLYQHQRPPQEHPFERPRRREDEGERSVPPTTNPARILHRLDLFQYHLKEM